MSETNTETQQPELSGNPMLRALQFAARAVEHVNDNPEIVDEVGGQVAKAFENLENTVNTDGNNVIDSAEMDALLQNPDRMEAFLDALPENMRSDVATKLNNLAEQESQLTDAQREQIPEMRSKAQEAINDALSELKEEGVSVEQQLDSYAERSSPIMQFMADKISPEVIDRAQKQVDGIVEGLPDNVELPENLKVSENVKETLEQYAREGQQQFGDELRPPQTPKIDLGDREPALSI